jgi:hypothetical protein
MLLHRSLWAVLAASPFALCGCGNDTPNPGGIPPDTGRRQWTKIEEKLDDAEAARVLTREHFDKIKDGMTLEEVSAVLGVKASTKEQSDECVAIWKGGGRSVYVRLLHGKVKSKDQQGLP